MALATRIATSRLTLRGWKASDARQLRESVLASQEELRRVFPWAAADRLSMADTTQWLADRREAFLGDRSWSYGIFDTAESKVLGGLDVRPGRRECDREISYWIRTRCTRRGYATEAVSAITSHLFTDEDVYCIVIRCQPTNARGAAIPERLGYTPRERDESLDDGPQSGSVWELTRLQFFTAVQLAVQPRPWLNR